MAMIAHWCDRFRVLLFGDLRMLLKLLSEITERKLLRHFLLRNVFWPLALNPLDPHVELVIELLLLENLLCVPVIPVGDGRIGELFLILIKSD